MSISKDSTNLALSLALSGGVRDAGGATFRKIGQAGSVGGDLRQDQISRINVQTSVKPV
jgi:hypothetical protein